jgi:uncharacterized protein
MKLCALFLGWLLLAAPALAQQSPADTPATKEDIQRYLDVMHSREMIHKLMDMMSQQVRQMLHQQVEQQMKASPGKFPPDFQARMDRMMDDTLKGIPVDELFDVMIPVYQQHLTKADIDAIVAFYSTPAGQKLVREMPAMTQDALQAAMPLIQKYMVGMRERAEAEVAAMIKDSSEKPKSDRP